MSSWRFPSSPRRIRSVLLAVVACLPASLLALTITEIHYNPGQSDSLEFIEIHNETTAPIDLKGFQFTRGVAFVFHQHLFLEGRGYLVVAGNVDLISAFYGITNVTGNWSSGTSLANGGETIEITNSQGVVQARVTYNDRGKWPVGADNTGHSLELENPYDELDDPNNWSISAVLGGSPGQENDTTTGSVPVVLNEGFFFGTADEQWVELYNNSLAEIDLSGYHVTTRPWDLSLAALPGSPKIPSRGFLKLTAAELGLAFPTDADGKIFVALTNPSGNRVINAFNFKPTVAGFSEARIPDGDRRFEAVADPTPDAPNASSVSDSIIINEIYYHAFDKDPGKEFVELYNRGNEPVDVGGWSFDDGIRFTIPDGISIARSGYLVVAREPEAIRATYGLAPDQVIGPESPEATLAFGVLRDGGERLTLVDDLGRVADTLRYYDGGAWPEWADGGGSSLELIDPDQDNSFAQAWDASDDSDKSETREYAYTGTLNSLGEQELHLLLVDRGITIVDDLSMATRIVTFEILTSVVDFGEPWKFLKGTGEPPEGWNQSDFDDAGWLQGPAPVGYTRRFEPGTPLDDMEDNYSSVYFRKEFNLDTLEELTALIIDIDFDDGFVLYVNGVELEAVNMDDGRSWDSLASAAAATDPLQIVIDDVANSPFRIGTNTLAVQLHNRTIGSNDCYLDLRLSDGRFLPDVGENLLQGGDFEADNTSGDPSWPGEDSNHFWIFDGNHIRSGKTATEALNGNGSLKIVATGRGDNKANKIETTSLGLSGLESDTDYHVSFTAKWIVGSPSLLTHGAYNSPSAAPNYAASHQLVIPANLGTPGAINSVTARQFERVGSSNMGPVIAKVEQSVPIPGATESLGVSAEVSDPDGVARVDVFFTGGIPRAEDDPIVQRIRMVDPDGDGVYEAVIPTQQLRQVVLYWIVAQDRLGLRGRFPADHLQRSHPLKLDPDDTSPADFRYLYYRHDAFSLARNLQYVFLMHDVAESYLTFRSLLSRDTVEGSFIFENNQIYHGAGIRFSGSAWSRRPWQSMGLRLPKDNHLWGKHRKFNLEVHQGSGGVDGRERIAHYLYRNMGTIYSDLWLVSLSVNDRIESRLQEHLSTPNRQYLGQWFPDDDFGPFFEVDDRFALGDSGTVVGFSEAKLLYPPYGSPEDGDNQEFYRYFFSSRGGNPFDDFSDLTEFAKVLTPHVTPDEVFDEAIFDVADVENFMKVWAIRMNIDDWDTWGTARGKNCYLYKPCIDGRWKFVGWDMELTFENGGSFMPPTVSRFSSPTYVPGATFPEVTRWINRPAVKRLFYGSMARMVRDGPFTVEFLDPYIEQIESQEGMFVGQKIRNFVEFRSDALLNVTQRVTSEVIDFSITTQGPVELSHPVATIDGIAPVEVRTVRVLINGEDPAGETLVEFSNESLVEWRYTTTLPAGTSTLTFVAFDFDDTQVGMASIEVTAPTIFVRGDANLSGNLDIADVLMTLFYTDGRLTPPCLDALDSDDNGEIGITDAVISLSYQFLNGPRPAAPFPSPARDPSDDSLGCETGMSLAQ